MKLMGEALNKKTIGFGKVDWSEKNNLFQMITDRQHQQASKEPLFEHPKVAELPHLPS